MITTFFRVYNYTLFQKVFRNTPAKKVIEAICHSKSQLLGTLAEWRQLHLVLAIRSIHNNQPKHLQNDHWKHFLQQRNKDVWAKCLLRIRMTFSQTLIGTVGISKFRYIVSYSSTRSIQPIIARWLDHNSCLLPPIRTPCLWQVHLSTRQGANYKKILRLSYDVIITYDNRKSNLR